MIKLSISNFERPSLNIFPTIPLYLLNSGNQCVTEQPVSGIGESGRNWNHFRDVKFTCQTLVVGWKFHANIIGDVHVGVMRHTTGNSYYITNIQR